MEPQTIKITSEPLPWWWRFLGLGRTKAAVQQDLEKAVRIANDNANLAERLSAEAEDERRGRERAAEERAKVIVELVELKERMKQQQARRNVSWPKPERAMSPAQLHRALNVPVDEPVFAAVMQRLDRAIQDALDVVSQPPSATLTEQHRLHLAGGIEHLRLLQQDLLTLRAEAEAETDGESNPE